MDEVVANGVFKQLKGKCSPVEAEEGGCASNFLGESINLVHYIVLLVSFHESYSASAWEGRLGVFYSGLAGKKDSATLSPAKVFVRT